MKNEEKIIIDDDKLNEILNKEVEKIEARGVKCTVGEVLTLVCKGVIRLLIGDEEFDMDLDEARSDEEYEAILRTAMIVLHEKLAKMIKIGRIARE